MIGTQSTLNYSKSIVRYHDPYTRLNLRAKVDHVIQSNPKFHQINVIDVFPMLDAIIKRGGCQKVKSRMEEIMLSLPYYDTNLIKKSKEQQFQPIMTSIQYISEPFIEQHFLPATSGQGYYELTKQQTTFARQNFSHIDQYLTIKSLAYFGAVLSKIGNAYLDKYYKLRRWLYINDLITNVKDEQFVAINKLHPKQNMYMQMNMNMGVPIANPYKYPQRVCVVGLTLANLIMGIKLSKLGYYVKIVERSYENIFKWSAGFIPDLIRQGIYLNNQLEAKRLNEILFNYVGASCEPVDEPEQNPKKIKQIKDSLLRYESTFLILLEQILRECPKNAGKLFWQQMHHRIMTINNNFQYRNKSCRINERIDLDGIRMYFERFIMLNKIKDELIVSVGDVKRFIEEYYMAEQPLAVYNNLIYRNSKTKMSINNIPYFLKPQKMKIKKYQQLISKDKMTNSNLNLNICVDSQVKKIEYKQNMWQITMAFLKDNKIFLEEFAHLIYSESESLQKSMKQRFFLPQLANPINFPILQQLNYHSQIHCLYRFTETIEFRGTNNKSIFTFYCSQIGTINFYLLPSKCEVFACMRKSIKYPSIDYYRQIYNILYDHILKNNPKLEYPKQTINENIEQCRYFSLKDQNMLDNIIKLRQKQNMYLSVPIICMYGNNSKNIVQNQMKINNKIITLICNSQTLYLRRVEKTIHPPVMPMQMPRGHPLPMSYNSIPTYVTSHKQVIPNVSTMPIGGMKMGMGMNMAPIQINPYQMNLYQEQNKAIKKPIHEDFLIKKKEIEQTKIIEIEKCEKKEMDIEISSQSPQMQKRQNVGNNPLSIKVKESIALSSIRTCEIINNMKQILWVSTQQITRFMTSLSISNQVNYSLSHILPHFSINMPIPLTNSLYLINLGFPSLSSLQTEYKDVFIQNMIILSISKNLINPSEQVIFYHACILYEDVPFYCVIQLVNHISPHPLANEGCLNILLLFHTSLQELNKCMGQILKQNEKMERNIGQEYKKAGKNKHLMICLIEKGINSQLNKNKTNQRAPTDRKLKQQYFGQKCSQILKDKIEKIHKQNNEQENTMQQQSEQILTKLQYSAADLINIVYQQADRYVNYLCGLLRLRPYSLEDLFMGKLNLKYIVSEIEDNFDKQNNTENEIKETQTMILCLKQEIKKYKLGSYPLGIYKNESTTIKRKFIDIDQQGYLIFEQLSYKPSIDYLSPYPCSNKSNKQSNGKWTKSIIQRLVSAQYPIYELIEHFNKLVRQQMQQIINVINMNSSAQHRKVFHYFAITRMDFASDRIYKKNQPNNGILERSAKRLQKLKEQIEKEYKVKQNQSMQSTLDEELDQISDMINQGNVLFDGNQIFASFYS